VKRTDRSAEETRGEWFAEHLGEEWRTAGDGIYTYVGPSGPRPTDPRDEPPPRRRDLMDTLDPSHPKPPPEDEPQPEPPSRAA
jgi:hypothetical protein